jgi:ubiquinone/menaquinone biosynthesis C-methylase UbiE
MTHGKDGMHSVNQSKHSEHSKRSELSELSRQETPLTFYEGKWVATNRTTRSLKNFIVKKERFFLKEMAAHRGLILDIGCGGGWSFFTLFDGVVGLDLSHPSLVNALDIYSSGVQGSSLKLPFQDESFDYVVSLDVLGHIHEDYKEQLLSEFFRVLKRGGSTLHYIETLSNDPISRFGRKYPDLNEKYICPSSKSSTNMHQLARTAQKSPMPSHAISSLRPLAALMTFSGKKLPSSLTITGSMPRCAMGSAVGHFAVGSRPQTTPTSCATTPMICAM